jgi:hypothetical protein
MPDARRPGRADARPAMWIFDGGSPAWFII